MEYPFAMSSSYFLVTVIKESAPARSPSSKSRQESGRRNLHHSGDRDGGQSESRTGLEANILTF